MYCHSCGHETDGTGLYCPDCGARLTDQGESASALSPGVVIRPVSTPFNALISIVPLQLFLTLWGAVVFGTGGFFLIRYLELDLNPWVPAVVSGLLFFLLTPAFAVYRALNRHAVTEYRFFDTRIEYHESYWGSIDRSIGYEHIIELNLHKSLRQQPLNLGTIILAISNPEDFSGRLNNLIRIPDIRFPDETYGKIKRIIDEFRRSKIRN